MRRAENEQPSVWVEREIESNLPKGENIEPIGVEVEKNDTEISNPIEVFEALVELSWIDKTPEEILSELNIRKWTSDNWETRFSYRDEILADNFDILYEFLRKYYDNQFCFIKMGDKEIYGKVEVDKSKLKLKTSKGILTMPWVKIIQNWGDTIYAFFPVKALISNSENGMIDLYKFNLISVSERDEIEKQILWLLPKLAMCQETKWVIETNKIWEQVEQVCKESWTVDKVWAHNWALGIHFGWRYAKDNSENYSDNIVLPPFEVRIAFSDWRIRGDALKHPHCLSDGSLCLGSELTSLAQDCIRDKTILPLIEGLIKFANSWTSNDADHTDRQPSDCIRRWANDNGWYSDSNCEPVSKEDLTNTIRMRFLSQNPTENEAFNRFLYPNE